MIFGELMGLIDPDNKGDIGIYLIFDDEDIKYGMVSCNSNHWQILNGLYTWKVIGLVAYDADTFRVHLREVKDDLNITLTPYEYEFTMETDSEKIKNFKNTFITGTGKEVKCDGVCTCKND